MSDNLLGTATNLFGLFLVAGLAKEGFKMFGEMGKSTGKSATSFFDWKLN